MSFLESANGGRAVDGADQYVGKARRLSVQILPRLQIRWCGADNMHPGLVTSGVDDITLAFLVPDPSDQSFASAFLRFSGAIFYPSQAGDVLMLGAPDM